MLLRAAARAHGQRVLCTLRTAANVSAARAVSAQPKRTCVLTTSARHGSDAEDTKAAKKAFKGLDRFEHRHIGPQENEIQHMLKTVGKGSMEEFIQDVVPENIRYRGELFDNGGRTETELLAELKDMLGENRHDITSFIGLGYNNTKTPHVILRNLIENPGWYTPYTPYQAEIAQGRLESLLNFQTLVTDLTGLPVANASLLDEATAAGEVVGIMLSYFRGKRTKFFIDSRCLPQTIEVVKTRASGFGVEVVEGKIEDFKPSEEFGALLVQYPTAEGNLIDYSALFAKAKESGLLCATAADILSLCSVKPPGEFGADIAVGSCQRFGVPLGYGGPHAAYMAARDDLKRVLPGRIIGVSRDVQGKRAYRMALQTREQHIKREKATSNICTAQALLANTAAMYAVYHGPEGLKAIAGQVHHMTKALAEGFRGLGHKVQHGNYFDTIRVELNGITAEQYVSAAVKLGVNVWRVNDSTIHITLDEVAEDKHLKALLIAGGASDNVDVYALKAASAKTDALGGFTRESKYLQHPVFNSYHCETEMMRYLFRLQSRDLGLNSSSIPLGSCTMKLNAATEMIPVTWPEAGKLHPFAPADQVMGYRRLIERLEERLKVITGFDRVSFQPNSGAQGEYAGLRVIQAYHKSRGEGHRNVVLIPTSAHGTNPATAAMCDLEIVAVKTDKKGSIDIQDLKAKAEQYAKNLAATMITYPSTYGVFEEGIKEITEIVHKNGGQVYIDGANLNAQLGLTRPADYGGDVCHMNLHKTFCIPHGGGGPGMGPIGVRAHLAPFLPGHTLMHSWGGDKPFGQVSAAGFGSASILPISYAYIEMMNGAGLKASSEVAILAANYLAARLGGAYSILFRGSKGFNAHEFILDVRDFKKSAGIEAEDIAKRLMDYGIHAPTLSFPVAGTLMVEPTESESLFELDRLADALLHIREEIREIEGNKADRNNNVLRNAPHTATTLISTQPWNRPYTPQKAAYPVKWVEENKFWPTVSRIDSAFGDRNFFCTCPPMDSY